MRVAIPLIEAVFVLVIAAGVWLLAGLGLALIVAGVFGVIGCEWADVRKGKATH